MIVIILEFWRFCVSEMAAATAILLLLVNSMRR